MPCLKVERDISPAPSVLSGTMAPPSHNNIGSSHQPSVARSLFQRSGAPSVETRQTEAEPLMTEVRMRGQGHARRSTPSSQQTADGFESFANTSFTDIGMKLKACNDTLGELQQLGIQHVAQLPELVLVGDQSAGKSSLMSGLATLNLPRSAGVCTRCPIHIRLSGSRSREANWSCTVSLQLEYDYKPPATGRAIKKSDVTRNNPFPPWVKAQQVSTKTFKTIYDPSDIEDVLRWAQVAILNHEDPFHWYIPGEGQYAMRVLLATATQETKAQFSPNIVALEIKAPHLPDLSFYDLPGVFLSPPQEEDQYLVEVVKNLTSHYIRKPQAIIMWALPMNQDPENSIALGIIRDAQAASRTIGIMTKADMVSENSTAQWIAMLKGEKHPVGLGYFITSRPPDQALDNADKWEENFFHSTGSWPRVFEPFGQRCGVELLKSFLEKKLGDAFASSLPTIKHKVNERLHQVTHDLSELPELPANVEHEVKKSLYTFYHAVKQAMKASDVQSQWDTLNKQFQSCILKMKPTCMVGDDQPPPTIELASDDEGSATTAETPSRKHRMPRTSDSTIRQQKRPRVAIGPGVEPASSPVKNEEVSLSQSVMTSPAPSMRATSMAAVPDSPFIRFHDMSRGGLNIVDIRKDIMRHKRVGLPNILTREEVYDDLILDPIRKWRGPLEVYVDLTIGLVRSVVQKSLARSLDGLKRRLIFRDSKNYLDKWIDDMEARQRAKLFDMFDAETYCMFTINDESFKQYFEAEKEGLHRARTICRLKRAGLHWDYKPPSMDRMTSEERAREKDMFNRYLPRLGEDPYDTEIQVAARVRGYYILAAMRFVDSVTLIVNSSLCQQVAGPGLDMFLDKQLGIKNNDEELYAHLMEEDDATADRRTRLKCESEKLRKAMGSINELEWSFHSDGVGVGFRHLSQPVVDDDDGIIVMDVYMA